MLEIVQFPNSKDFGGFNVAYLAALKKHQDYIKFQREKLTFTKGKKDWCDDKENIIHVQVILPLTDEKNKAARDNLVGYACNQGKRIVKACKFEQDNSLFYYAKIS